MTDVLGAVYTPSINTKLRGILQGAIADLSVELYCLLSTSWIFRSFVPLWEGKLDSVSVFVVHKAYELRLIHVL